MIVETLSGSGSEPIGPIYDPEAYLSYASMTTPPNLIHLFPAKKRPAGTTFATATSSSTEAYLLEYGENPTKVLVDSGADITLISSKHFMSLKPRPTLKEGRELRVTQLNGQVEIKNFVHLPTYFDTEQGPVLIHLEAYVVPGMTTPLLIGNDYADQYRLSIVRPEDGPARLQFSDTGRTVKLKDSIHPSDEVRVLIGEATPHAPKTQRGKALVSEAITIPSKTIKKVKVDCLWPMDTEELYIEAVSARDSEGRDFYVYNTIINPPHSYVIIANYAQQPLMLRKGEPIARTSDPRDCFSIPSSEEEATAYALNTMMKEIRRPQEGEPEPEGGPKEAIDLPDEIKEEDFLASFDFGPTLKPVDKQRLQEVLLRNKAAFAINGRL